MKPGATTRPSAAMVRDAGSSASTIRPSRTPRSPVRGGEPVPSTIVPPVIKRSSTPRSVRRNWVLHFSVRTGSIEHVFGVDCIREGVAQVASEDRSAWPSGARTARLIELRELEDLLHAQVLRAVADSDAVDAWHDDCLGSVSWLASKT